MWPRRAPERAGCRGFGVQAIAPWLLERRISNCRAPSERHGSNELRGRRPERKSTAWRNEDSGPPARPASRRAAPDLRSRCELDRARRSRALALAALAAAARQVDAK